MSAARVAAPTLGDGTRRSEEPAGLLYGSGAYAIWGMFPAFFGLLSLASPIEIVAHRVAWTLMLMLAVLAITGRLGTLRQFSIRTWLLVAAGAASISLNWGTYVYAVLSGHVAEGALGYFINPLVSVAIGVALFRERMTTACWCALILAGIAVVVLTIAYHRIPIIALTLAGSFALYGVIKKLTPMAPATSLTAETLVLAPLAVGYLTALIVLPSTGTFTHSATQLVLLALCGPMTAAPLLLFAAAAHRLPVISIGVLQYLTPILQLLWAVAVRHEPLSTTTWFGFVLVWLALLIFTGDAIRQASLRSRNAKSPPAEGHTDALL